MFTQIEAACLLPRPAGYDVPIFTRVKVHRDFHVEVGKALYSVPAHLLGAHPRARADTALVKLFAGGGLVKTHPRQRPGGRSTDPVDLPAERAGYAMRDLTALVATAAAHGPNIGIYAERLLDDVLPWTRMRAVYRLLSLVRRHGRRTGRGGVLTVAGPRRRLGHEDRLDARQGHRARPCSAARRRGLGGRPVRPRAWRVPDARRRPAHPHPRRRRRTGDHTMTTTSAPDTTQRTPGAAGGSGPVDSIGSDLTRTLRALKLSGLKDTLPERLALARQHKMGHAAFLELLLADEVARRDSRSAMLRARAAGLDPTMRLDTWDEPDDLRYDRTLWSDLTSLRFTDAHHGVLILGPVGVGKTHLAAALGHIGIRRRMSVHFSRTDKLFTRLRAARLDNTLEAEIRRLARVEILILDDFALRPLDATQTNDFYELVVERHRKTSTIVTSNREPAEWLTMTSDALLAQSAIDRLTSGAHTLIVEGPSYRQRGSATGRAAVDTESEARDAH